MRIDLDELERKARAATQGTWRWFGNTKTYSVYLATVEHGRQFVMDFVRWGMSEAQPRFQVDHFMAKLSDLAADESPLGPKFEVPYRRDFAGIGHPDAEHIAAASPPVVLALISRIHELEGTVRSFARRELHGEEIVAALDAVLAKGAVMRP